MLERSSIFVSINKLPTEPPVAIIRTLVEGSSIRATSGMTGAAKNAVVKLPRDLGGHVPARPSNCGNLARS